MLDACIDVRVDVGKHRIVCVCAKAVREVRDGPGVAFAGVAEPLVVRVDGVPLHGIRLVTVGGLADVAQCYDATASCSYRRTSAAQHNSGFGSCGDLSNRNNIEVIVRRIGCALHRDAGMSAAQKHGGIGLIQRVLCDIKFGFSFSKTGSAERWVAVGLNAANCSRNRKPSILTRHGGPIRAIDRNISIVVASNKYMVYTVLSSQNDIAHQSRVGNFVTLILMNDRTPINTRVSNAHGRFVKRFF